MHRQTPISDRIACVHLQKRMEEVERHNLSLNENVKNCAHLIQLTQSFAEEQGHEQVRFTTFSMIFQRFPRIS